MPILGSFQTPSPRFTGPLSWTRVENLQHDRSASYDLNWFSLVPEGKAQAEREAVQRLREFRDIQKAPNGSAHQYEDGRRQYKLVTQWRPTPIIPIPWLTWVEMDK
ncbi:MAG: hypothetical protein SFZ03_10905 [Candidatus Melainabacteria bacterium]|nr:hypothetical protein [Candidatus Melainabacteria bacterium]